MTHLKAFFHDRIVLFLLTINSFLALVTIGSILLRLGGGKETYIQSYRSNLGISSLTAGGVSDMLSFVFFAVVLLPIHVFLAIRFYVVRKTSAWIVMALTTFLLLLNIIVANALLNLLK